MPKCWCYKLGLKLIYVSLLSLFLIACGGGKSDPEQVPPGQIPPVQVTVLSAELNFEKVSINSIGEHSADVVLTREFDDGTQTTVNLVISWDGDNLSLKDDADNDIELDFDKNMLLAGEAEIIFKDPVSNLEIEFKLELVPEESEPVLTGASLSEEKLTIDLNVSDLSNVNLIRNFDDESEANEQLSIVWSKDSNTLILKRADDAEIQLTYDATDTTLIPVTFIDPVSNIELSIEIVIVDVTVVPVELTIKQYVLTPDMVELTVEGETTLGLSVVMSDDSQGVVPDGVICQLEAPSEIITVTSDCKVNALQVGEAIVTITGPETIADSLIQKATINVSAKPEPVISITKVEIDSHDLTLLEGLELSLSLTLTYSNGDIKTNEFDVVKCRSSSEFVRITSGCVVKGVSSGNAVIELEVLNGDTPTVIGSEIEILARSITQLRMFPSNEFLQIGDSQLFTVFADYDNGVTEDVTADSICMVSTAGLSVSEFCDITALQNGDVEVSARLKDGMVVDVLAASVVVSDILVMFSGENVLLDPDYFGGDINSNISCVLDFASGVEANCEVFALFPGDYEVTAKLKDVGNVTRPFIVKAVPLGDLSKGNEFLVDVPPNISDIVYEISNVTMDEIYKVSMFGTFLSPDIGMQVLPDLTGSNTCSNRVYDVAGALERKVTCGVAARSDKIYVRLTPTFFDLEYGVQANISVVPDVDILQFAGPLKSGGGSNSSYLATYDFAPLIVGQTLVDGHVPANLDGLNTSRYFSDDIDLGMKSAANEGNLYAVSVTFDSPNYNPQSVKIQWYSGAEVGIPGTQCYPEQDLQIANTLTCTFGNEGQHHIFVEILGNGVSGLSNVTGVDGEIGYTINLTQF